MERKRGWFLTIAAVLFALLALSNFLKPILADSHTGFVFFGRRLSGVGFDTADLKDAKALLDELGG